jgi:hypothetical protein
MSAIIHLVLSVSLAFAATAAQWRALENKNHAECDEDHPCRIEEGGLAFNFQLQPLIKLSSKNLPAIQIKSLKPGGAEQVFALKEVNTLALDEKFEVQTISGFRPGAAGVDLAVYAYSSAREGKMYYYFLFDAAAGKFVAAGDPLPKLIWDAQKKVFSSELHHVGYVLGKDLRFSPANK